MMKVTALLLIGADTVSAFQMPKPSMPKLRNAMTTAASTVTAASITFHAETAHAKSIVGINGGLDFGPLAGDQPGGEGTGKALGINDDSLFAVFGFVIGSVFFAFSQWQEGQDDDEDFFDSYDSRRNERQDSRNRDLQAGADENRQFGTKKKVFGSR